MLESANMANRRDQRPTFEGSRGGINQRKSNNSVLLASEPAEQQLRATVRCPPEAGKTRKVQTWQTVETGGLLLRDHVGSAIKT